MLYILDIHTKLPKLNYNYRDGDYLNFLRNELSRDSLNELMNTIIDFRKHMCFYKRIFSNDSCITQYIFENKNNREDTLNYIKDFYSTTNIEQTYNQYQEDMTIKDYIFYK